MALAIDGQWSLCLEKMMPLYKVGCLDLHFFGQLQGDLHLPAAIVDAAIVDAAVKVCVFRSFVHSILRPFFPSGLRSFFPSGLRSYRPSFLCPFVPSANRSFVLLPSALRSFCDVFKWRLNGFHDEII